MLPDPSGSSRSLQLLSRAPPPPTPELLSPCLSVSPSHFVCRISVKARGDPRGRRFCPARHDLSLSRYRNLTNFLRNIVPHHARSSPRYISDRGRRYSAAVSEGNRACITRHKAVGFEMVCHVSCRRERQEYLSAVT